MHLFWLAAVLAVDAGSPDAGAPDAGIYVDCPSVEGAMPALPVRTMGSFMEYVEPDGGALDPGHSDYLLPYPRGQRQACKLAACEERVRDYEATPPAVPLFTKTALTVMGLVGSTLFLLGLYLGWSAYGFVHH